MNIPIPEYADAAYTGSLGITADRIHIFSERSLVPDKPRYRNGENSRNDQLGERNEIPVNYSQRPPAAKHILDISVYRSYRSSARTEKQQTVDDKLRGKR